MKTKEYELTAYYRAMIIMAIDRFPLKKALDSIKKQIPEDKKGAALKFIKKFLLQF